MGQKAISAEKTSSNKPFKL